MTFAHRLKVACQICGISMAKAAQIARVSPFTVYQASIGRHITKVDTVQRLARALGVRTGWLLEGEGEIFPVGKQKSAGAVIAPASVPLFSDYAKVSRAKSIARTTLKKKPKSRPSVSAAAIRDLEAIAQKSAQKQRGKSGKRRKS